MEPKSQPGLGAFSRTPPSKGKNASFALGRLLSWGLTNDARRFKARFDAGCLELVLGRYGCLRVRATGSSSPEPDLADAIVRGPLEELPLTAEAVEGGVEIRPREPEGVFSAEPWRESSVRLASRGDGTLEIVFRAGAARLFEIHLLEFGAHGESRAALVTGMGARYYGFGEKTGPLEKSGMRFCMRTRDFPVREGLDPLYAAIPFFLWSSPAHKSGSGPPGVRWYYGCLIECFAPSRMDVARSYNDRVIVETDGWGSDLTVFLGPHPKAVLHRYSTRTGFTPLPPLWSLGYHQSRWSYDTQAEVLEIASEFRRRRIPLDAIHIDIDYMDGFRVFTWDKKRFPDPAAMMASLTKLGVKAVCIVDPGIKADPSFEVYRKVVEGAHLCLDRTGKPFTMWVWPRKAVFCDFDSESARRFWGSLHQDLLDIGVSGIWNDMNEPAGWRFDVRVGRKVILPLLPQDTSNMLQVHPVPGHSRTTRVPHEQVRNIYAYQQCRALVEYLERERPDRRYFVLTRSGYAGIQRFAAMWTGDIASRWSHLAMSLQMLLGLSVSGVGFCGADVGGFVGRPSPELFARWIQLGSFYPFFRTHTQGIWGRQEPWSFGPEVEDIARTYIRLRMSLLPQFYTSFEEFSRTGVPPLRPLFVEHPDDERAATVDDEALLGPGLLVAPIVRKGARSRAVYFPAGEWVRLDSGGLPDTSARTQRILGPRKAEIDAPLHSLPLYAAAGSAFLWQPPVDCVEDVLSDVPPPLFMHVIGHSGEWFRHLYRAWPEEWQGVEKPEYGPFWYYEDDGVSKQHTKGRYLRVPVRVSHTVEEGVAASNSSSDSTGGPRPIVSMSIGVRADQGDGTFETRRSAWMAIWLPPDGELRRIVCNGRARKPVSFNADKLWRELTEGDRTMGLESSAGGDLARVGRTAFDPKAGVVLVPWKPGRPLTVDVELSFAQRRKVFGD